MTKQQLFEHLVNYPISTDRDFKRNVSALLPYLTPRQLHKLSMQFEDFITS